MNAPVMRTKQALHHFLQHHRILVSEELANGYMAVNTLNAESMTFEYLRDCGFTISRPNKYGLVTITI